MNDFLKYVIDNFLGGLSADVRFTRGYGNGGVNPIPEFNVEETDNGAVFTPDIGGYKSFKVIAEVKGDSVLFSVDIKHEFEPFSTFRAENAVNFSIGGATPDAIRYYYHRYTCCLEPALCHSFEELGRRTHTALVKIGDEHFNILGLAGDIYRCDFDGEGYHISIGSTGYTGVKGPILAITRADDPFEAIDRNYAFAREMGAITVPLKGERELPDCFKGLGYCTFNTYELDITEEKVFAKLDEYKAAGVPLNWVLIDDGWQTYEDHLLLSMREHPVKFHSGLKYLVDRIKNEYGVKYVGLWHAIGVYWHGFKEGSEAFNEQKDNLMQTLAGAWVPSTDEEKGFALWDSFYAYLKSCGVDFVKIDSQGVYPLMVEGLAPSIESTRKMHTIIEKAALKNFGTCAVLNCMGMDIENVFTRPMSAISRNSRDFSVEPDDVDHAGFHDYTMVNALGAIWHDKTMYCDYDMWWSSDKGTARHSAVLRSIHDGPNYLSDPGPCDAEVISHAVGDNGEHYLCDHAAYPTLDCIYGQRDLFKVWNRSGENFALAVYNIKYHHVNEGFKLSVVPGMDKDTDYIAFEYFTGKYSRVNVESELQFDFEPDGFAAYSIYPIKKDEMGEYVMMGDTTKYISIAHPDKVRRSVAELV